MLKIVEDIKQEKPLLTANELEDGKIYRHTQYDMIVVGFKYRDIVAFSVDGSTIFHFDESNSRLFKEIDATLTVHG